MDDVPLLYACSICSCTYSERICLSTSNKSSKRSRDVNPLMNKGLSHQKKLLLKILAVASGGLALYSARKIRRFSSASNISRNIFIATETLNRMAIEFPKNPEPRNHSVRHCAMSNNNVRKKNTLSRDDGRMVRVCSK